MFYCEPCGEAAEWPTDFWLPMSHGRCEMCERVAGCFDVPSSILPTAAAALNERLADLTPGSRARPHVIKEEP